MEKRRLGRTGLEVTVISFGALPIQRTSLDDAGPVLQAALNAGINFIDTARGYSDSEEKIGRHIAARRCEYYLATKSRARDKAGMANDIATSLNKMKTDAIDLYQIHNIKTRQELDAVMAPGGALEALEEAKAQGRIGHIGVTGHNIDLLVEAIKSDRFSTVQVPFNHIERHALQELVPLAQQMDIGIIVMKPLGGGQMQNAELALRFVLNHGISVAIPGMDEVRHIEENLRAARPIRPLTVQEQAELAQEAETLGPNFCRRCGYCMPCTVGIDIPTSFILHLQYVRYDMKTVIPERYAGLKVKASECIECGICEQRCPYDLPIRDKLKAVARDLG